MWPCPSATQQISGQAQARDSSSSWDLPADVPRRAQPHSPSSLALCPLRLPPSGLRAAANLLQTTAHPGSLSQWEMAAGESRKRATLYDSAPNIAADPVFCSGDFLSFLWSVSVGTPP